LPRIEAFNLDLIPGFCSSWHPLINVDKGRPIDIFENTFYLILREALRHGHGAVSIHSAGTGVNL